MNPKEFVHNTAYSVQLPYIAGLSLQLKLPIVAITPFHSQSVFHVFFGAQRLSKIASC